MYINLPRREMKLKVVYYGPPLSGKTTNLVRIHDFADPNVRGELISLATAEDRTLYFDFLRIDLRRVNGLTPRLHLYTVPGQPQYEASRKMVLRGADGVVFVADSAADRLDENLQAWKDMKRQLGELSLDWEALPTVVQFNKQDVPNALPPSTLRYLMHLNGMATFEAVATRGKGVRNTLRCLLQDLMNRVEAEAA
jgi:signal recognition particle receptor subunit beta